MTCVDGSRRFDVNHGDPRARLGSGEAVEVQPFEVGGDCLANVREGLVVGFPLRRTAEKIGHRSREPAFFLWLKNDRVPPVHVARLPPDRSGQSDPARGWRGPVSPAAAPNLSVGFALQLPPQAHESQDEADGSGSFGNYPTTKFVHLYAKLGCIQ